MSCGCGCPGGCDDATRELALRDPLLAKSLAFSSGVTMGRFGVWPQETRDLIARIEPSMSATNTSVDACTGLAKEERDAWKSFFGQWRAFAAEEVTIFGSARKYDEAEAYNLQLADWQDQLASKCKLSAPRTRTDDPDAATASLVKWVVVGALGVSLVYGLRLVLK